MSPRDRILAALRGRLSSDGGFSLPELLISIVLLSIVSGAIVASTVAIQRNLGVADATMNDLAFTRIGIERVGTLLRGAVSADGRLRDGGSAFDTAATQTAQDITFHSISGRTVGQNPVKVRLFVNAQGDLVERRWDPSPANYSGAAPSFPGPTRDRVIIRDVQDPDSTTGYVDLFRFWSHLPSETDPRARCGREVAIGSLTVAQMPLVDSVSYRLVVREPNGYINSAADLQGWARFASNVTLGYSSSYDSVNCLDERGFGYGEVYRP